MTRAVQPFRDRVALALLALALVARVLVPSGWMPAESGGFAITPCSGMGELHAPAATHGDTQLAAGMHMRSGMHGSMPMDHSGKHSLPDHPCAFAGLGAPVLASEVPPPSLALAAPRQAMGPAIEAIATIGRGLAAPPPPPTGPPAAI